MDIREAFLPSYLTHTILQSRLLMSKVIGIIGSRRRNYTSDYLLVKEAFEKVYEDGDTIVSGGCPQGGDHFAETIASSKNIPIKIHPAQWNKHGRAAGFIRNTEIARDSDVLIACVAEDRKSGTENTIRKFLTVFNKSKDKLVLV